MKRKKSKIAFVTLLVASLVFSVVFAYCYVKYKETNGDGIFLRLTNYNKFVGYGPAGFAVLLALWAVLGVTMKVTPMDKFKVASITLLFLTLAMIGALMYCEGYIGWVESHYGRQDSIFRDFPPILPYHVFLEHAWVGFAFLSVLWSAFGFIWLVSTKEPMKKLKGASIASIVATLALLTIDIYWRYSGVVIRPDPLRRLINLSIRLGFLALFAIWIVLGALAYYKKVEGGG